MSNTATELKAMAINDFLHLLSQGVPPRAAFERALDPPEAEEATYAPHVPSNLVLEVRRP